MATIPNNERKNVKISADMAVLKSDIAKGLANVATGKVNNFDSRRIIERGKMLLAIRSSDDSPRQP